ncbi:MAG: xanthine dehydrogenase family protein molybdopterin-binding subunit [Vicinamibacterales bacterium]
MAPLVGSNYTTPDIVAKVTGQARYAEDHKAEGMLFAKMLLSPMPHCRVTRIDTSAALAMPGVRAILTPADLPGARADSEEALGEGVAAAAQPERVVTDEPVYEGEPILAVAAVDELTAAEAIERIVVELEPLPFIVDPVETLKPGSPNARLQGNVWKPGASADAPPEIGELKWTAEDFAAVEPGQLPFGPTTDQWEYGDVEAGLAAADLVLDETFVSPSTSHQPLETRTAMAYWQNGKLYLHGSTQSTVQTVSSVARWVGIEPENVVVISEYTGGGFGSKIPGSPNMSVPALLSRMANAPVQLRITREEEHYIGRARPGLHSRVRVGFRKDGRILAVDGIALSDNGPYNATGDPRTAGDTISLAYQPLAMRWRSMPVLTNTPPKGAQRAPGGMQGQGILETVLGKAARQMGIDEVEIHRINAPSGKAPYGGPNAQGARQYVTDCHVVEAIDRGRELFGWDARKARAGQRAGSKVRGVGMAVSTYSAGSIGYDGLFVIKPDGRVQFQSGIGNHGTHSVIDVHRVAADIIGVPWEKCEVVWGNTGRHLPWTCSSGGSQTTHAMTRAAHAAGMDAKRKLQEIAAQTLGGSPESYQVANERVFSGGRSMTLAQAAQRAITLGGKYDGHEPPEDVNDFTKTSAAALAGQGLMGIARDTYGRDGQSRSFVVGFAEVEVDVETGAYAILDFAAIADVGTVINPRSLQGQTFGGLMLGIGHAISQKWVYDHHYGVPLAKRFHYNKPPTILDAPHAFTFGALNIADPESPAGARGVGEPPVGAGFGAILNALASAVGDEIFRRAPVTADMILTSLEAGMPVHERLTTHI